MATPLFVIFKHLALLNSYLGIILADATLTVPFAILVLRPFFLRIPRDLESAAMVDGCRPLGAFLRVVLPVSRPGVITVAVLSFLLAWGEFLFALSLTTSTERAAADRGAGQVQLEHRHAVEPGDGGRDRGRGADRRASSSACSATSSAA